MKLETISAMRIEDKKLFKFEITSGVQFVQSQIIKAAGLTNEDITVFELDMSLLAAALITYKIIEIKPEGYKDALSAAAEQFTFAVFETGDTYEQIGPLAPAASLTEE